MFLRVSKDNPERVGRPIANDSSLARSIPAKLGQLDKEVEFKRSSQYTELKMRLHQRLLDMINLSVIEKMPPEEFRRESTGTTTRAVRSRS